MKTVSEPPLADSLEKGLKPKLNQASVPSPSWNSLSGLWHRKTTIIAAFSIASILLHLVLRFAFHTTPRICQIPLLATLVIGGLPLLYDLLRKVLKREFGSDLLGGISIITSILLGEYLAGSIIVLMLSGGTFDEAETAVRDWLRKRIHELENVPEASKESNI
jgi:cation transport ATPase